MNQSPSRCPKCEGEIELGFILDSNQGGQVVSRWAAGTPQKSFWTGTKRGPDESIIPIGAFRCASCGYLESYARLEFAAR